jgi:predicted GNAT family acetyltransferase
MDRNAVTALHHFALNSDGAEIIQDSGILTVTSATAYQGAFHNGVVRVNSEVPAELVLNHASRVADCNRRDYILWTSAHRDADLEAAATQAGFHRRYTAVGMIIEHRPPRPSSPPTEVVVTQVSSSTDVGRFAHIHESVFRADGKSAEAVTHYANGSALLAANVTAFLAWADKQPVACAMTLHDGFSAGIYWVATIPSARRKGLGDLVTRTAVWSAFDHGASHVVLQATTMGYPVYERIGFRPLTEYGRYLVPAEGIGSLDR